MVLVVDSGKSTKNSMLAVNSDLLQGVTKNRAEMEFSFDGHELHYKLAKGSYRGTIPIYQLEAEVPALLTARFQASSSLELGATFIDVLNEGMVCSSILDVYTKIPLVTLVTYNHKTGLMISCFDRHHFALYLANLNKKLASSNFKIAIPRLSFEVMDRVAKLYSLKKGTSLSINNSLIVGHNNYLLSLPIVQESDENFEMTYNYVQSIDKVSYKTVLNRDSLVTMTSNLMALYSLNSNFTLEFGRDTLTMTISSENGSATETIDIEPTKNSPIVVTVEPKVFNNLLSPTVGAKELTLEVIENKCIIITRLFDQGKDLTLVCSVV
jgi:hypothetical protein